MVQPLRSINPRPRLVVCDFDGTLLNGPGPVSPAVRQAMQDVVDAGHWITVCTGRGYQLLQPFLGQFVVNAPLICCNGALILEPDSLRPIFAAPTPLDVAHDAVRLAVTRGWRVLAYLADMQTLLYYGYSPFDPPQTARSGYQLVRDAEVVDEGLDPLTVITGPLQKLMVLAPRSGATPEFVSAIQGVVGDRARVVLSSPRAAELLVPGASKAEGLKRVARRVRVRRRDTIAIGDGDNDIDMLRWAGVGIAMGNAMPAAKAIARWVAPPVDQDGVAAVLGRFLRGEIASAT
ncbi:MAG TPA: Cof-type HAD-IIB family hydrolase [Anaerolineae bacterium]|nr:Cof-type HAD-IIB family hydrolase [Anaerolineae bacterium]HQJ51066.1 Cof-type HAD-IIB family hydrolase [Anaerolineae bacterium]